MSLKIGGLWSRVSFDKCCISLTQFISRKTRSISYEAVKKRRNEIFVTERKRQMENVGRVEKIDVKYFGIPQNSNLVMNKGISTPYNCAQHISEMILKRSALALIDDVTLWDMHRPLEGSCSLKLLHMKDNDPYHVNKAFWRTCSLILGAIVSESFKENISVSLHSFPPPNVRSGSFVYDVELGLSDWKPTQDELRLLSGLMMDFCHKEHILERLSVNSDLALDMFEDNPHKSQQIPDIASQSPSGKEVVLYRVGDHIDISRGPCIANTNLVGRCSIVAVHRIEEMERLLYRFQGVALPQGFLMNHFAYGILENRAKNLNQVKAIPVQPQEVAAA